MRIADARKKQHLSQAELAAQIPVSRSTVAMWETGKCRPGPDHAMALARMLRLKLEQIYAPQGKAA